MTTPANDLHWFKSSYSGSSASDCVEAACAPSAMFVRDSKRPDRAVLKFPRHTFAAFLTAVKTSQSF